MTPPAMAVANRTVGDVLLEHGTITEAQLEQAVARQQATGQPIGQILVESGVITRLDLASALAEQWSDAPHMVQMEKGGNGNGKPSSLFTPLSEPIAFSAPTAGSDPAVGELRSFVQVFAARLDAIEARSGAMEVFQERLVEVRQMVTGLADWASGPELRIAELESRHKELGETVTGVSGRLDQLISGLDRAITGLEDHAGEIADQVEALNARADGFATADALAELKALVDDVVARPAADPAAVAELAVRVDAAATGDQLAEVRALVEDLAARPVVDPTLVEQVAALASRLDDLDSRTAALADVDVSAGIAEATASIAARLDAIEGETKAQGEILAGTATADAVEGLRAEMGVLGARIEEVAAAPAFEELRSATDALRVAVDDLAARPAVDPTVAERLEALSARLDAAAAAAELEELRSLVGELVDRPGVEPERLEALGDRVAELTTRLDGLAVSADGKVDVNVIGELRDAIDAIAARPAGDPDLAARVDALSAGVESAVAPADLDAVRELVDALAARLDDPSLATSVAELRGQVEELAARPIADPALAERIEDLEGRPAADPALAARMEALEARLDAVAVSSDGSVDVSVVTELRARIDELAARPVTDAALAGEVDNLRAAVTDVATRVAADAGLAEDLAALRLEVATLGAVGAGGVDAAVLDAVAARLDAVERQTVGAAAGGVEAEDVARLAGRIEELGSRIEAVALEAKAVVVSGDDTAVEAPVGEIDKLRVSVESLWMRMAEFQKSVAALLDPRGISGKLEKIEARLDLLETRQPVAAPVAAGGGESSGDLREIARRIEEMESASSSARDTLLTSLERIASTIDWRLQRLERPPDEPGT